MRYGVLAALGTVVVLGGPASADPGWAEGNVFAGVDDFGPKIGLGDALAPEQRPQTSPMLGGRLTYIALAVQRLELGVEGELAFTPSWTGYGFDGPRMSYFAPVLGYRANVVARLRLPLVSPHVVAGAGGETVLTNSPFMANDTDPLLYYGIGATFDVMPGWQVRVDGRQGFMPARDGSTTATYELLVGIGTRFGAKRAPVIVPEHTDPIATGPLLPPPVETDGDGDGVPDSTDRCPLERGPKDNGGCPEPDPDGDGIVGKADKCPDQAEDFDHFEDEDGCPDPDNDRDGIVDAKDACPNDPETKNGIDDDDGCPDTIPDAVAAAFMSASAARFESGRVRLTEAAKLALDKALSTLRSHPTIHVVVTAHPDKGEEKATELAKKRAEVVKWYLVEQGIPADQLDTSVGEVVKPKGTSVELTVAPK